MTVNFRMNVNVLTDFVSGVLVSLSAGWSLAHIFCEYGPSFMGGQDTTSNTLTSLTTFTKTVNEVA